MKTAAPYFGAAIFLSMNISITFSNAKNGSKTCSLNGVPLHSNYNPEREARQFVDSVDADFLPSFILITEPALSYCVLPLKERFPGSKICAVRYCRDFKSEDKFFDRVFYLDKPDYGKNLESELFSYMGDEGICSCRFLSWLPAAKIFPAHDKAAWGAVKNTVKLSQASLVTHSYFAQRWFGNACIFCSSVKKTAFVKRGNMPVVITASGSSLENLPDLLKKCRNTYFLIALSSSLLPLLNAGIKPDIVLSCDGGYWAKRHLEVLQNHHDIPVALSVEAACPKKIMETNTVIPLGFSDGLETVMAKSCGFELMNAERNGTVSGTALKFALDITDGDVYFCGLDLAPGKGLQHCRPNRLELIAEISDDRIKSKESRIARARVNSHSLEIYRQWFSAENSAFKGRVYRLSENFKYENSLGSIEDADFTFFNKRTVESSKKSNFCKIIMENTELSPCSVRAGQIESFIASNSSSEEWLHSIFPAEYLSWKRSVKDGEQKFEVLEKKNEDFLTCLQRKLCRTRI